MPTARRVSSPRQANLVAGEGPTAQSLMKIIGLGVVAQLYGLISGEGPKAVVSLAAPKAAAAVSAGDGAPIPGWTFKLTWAVVGAAIAALAAMGLSTLKKS